ncbi:MAG: tripartite tricarboxylate transporter permease [Moorella humiferrea]|nr:tripartite tricarboxylate transporter permease [Moorella humiferrea]
MDTFSNLIMGLSVALQPINLLYTLIGVITGILVGVLPGLGPSGGLAILLPLTFGVNPVSAIMLLAGIYYGAMYGGSITSIIIGVPGDPASVMTTIDGHKLALQGRAGAALGMACFASFIGGTLSVIAFTFLAPALASVTLSFGPPEYFALMVLGLTTLAGMTGKDPLKGFMSAAFGLFLASIGLDLVSGLPRFSFGRPELYTGIDFIVVAMGVFGIAEVLVKEETQGTNNVKMDLRLTKLFPTLQDWAASFWHIVGSTPLGFFIGMLPGAGATIATFISYGTAKRFSRDPEKFGEGTIEGVAAPECANNAAAIGAFIPLLTLGVPGSASTAVMMGALLMLGLRPGPLLFSQNPDFIWGLIGSMYIGNLVLVILMLLAIPLITRILTVPLAILNPIVVAFVLVGAYTLNNSYFDVFLTILFGAIGYFMKKTEIPAAPMILALVLGNLLENSMRQSLIISNGNPMIFISRPIAGVILIIAMAFVVIPLINSLRNYNKREKIAT